MNFDAGKGRDGRAAEFKPPMVEHECDAGEDFTVQPIVVNLGLPAGKRSGILCPRLMRRDRSKLTRTAFGRINDFPEFPGCGIAEQHIPCVSAVADQLKFGHCLVDIDLGHDVKNPAWQGQITTVSSEA